MKVDLSRAIEQLVQEAPRSWLEAVCAELQSSQANTLAETVLQKLPPTHNGDLAYQLSEVVRLAYGVVSWEGAELCDCNVYQSSRSLADRAQDRTLVGRSGAGQRNARPAY